MVKKVEMKLMDLARIISEMPVEATINFTQGPGITSEEYGGWIGVKRIDEFAQTCRMYLIGCYRGAGNARLYNISKNDPAIGDFCYQRSSALGNVQEDKEPDCIGRMLADYLMRLDHRVFTVLTVELDEELYHLPGKTEDRED